MCTDIVCDFGDVGVVKCGVDFIEDEERGWLVAEKKKLSGGLLIDSTALTCGWQRAEREPPLSSPLQKAVPYLGTASLVAWRGI